MMKLRINPVVAEDLKNIKEYIAEDNEEMAVKTIQEIYAQIENIQQFPYMGADLAKRVSFRTHYKLWLESTNVLSMIFNQSVFIDCESLLCDIEEDSRRFVETSCYNECIDILEKKRMLLLLGKR